MSKDYARKKSTRGAVAKRGGKGATGKNAVEPRNWTWFFSGVLCGVFLSFLVWLGAQQPDPQANPDAPQVAAKPRPATAKPDFTFYSLLPEQDVKVEVDPAEVASARRVEGMDQYLLQAGSFRQQEDAERRRAELIMLGLDPKVQETKGQNGRWHRVYIGPFESRSKLQNARSLTAQEGIETLMLKRPAP